MPISTDNLEALHDEAWHKAFDVAIAIKSFNAVWETVSGIILLTFSAGAIERLVFSLTHNGSWSGPVGIWLEGLAPDAKAFFGTYVLAHGIMNAILVYCVFRLGLRAFLIYIALLSLFLAYQIFRTVITPSTFLLTLTVFDAAFIVLTVKEYERRKARMVDKRVLS